MNQYKYYFFYIKSEYKDNIYLEQIDSLLYAYTDNKEYYKLFKESRNMNKFIIKKKLISRKEVNDLARYYQKSYLIEKIIKTKCKDKYLDDYKLIITSNEWITINNTYYKLLKLDILNFTWTTPFIFKDKYIEALNKIEYIKNHKCYSGGKATLGEEIIKPDLLSIFIHIYQELI